MAAAFFFLTPLQPLSTRPSLLPPAAFRSPSLPFRAFWLYRFFRATLRAASTLRSRIPKEKESWVPGIENLNTYDPEERFYAKCALSNGEKTRFLLLVTKNYLLDFSAFWNIYEINLSRRKIINNKDIPSSPFPLRTNFTFSFSIFVFLAYDIYVQRDFERILFIIYLMRKLIIDRCDIYIIVIKLSICNLKAVLCLLYLIKCFNFVTPYSRRC